MGPGKDTHGTTMPQREGRGWHTTRSIVRQTCTTKKRQAPLSLTTCMVAELSPVQLKTGSSSEQKQIVDALDNKLTDSLWAVTRNRDSETRQATQVNSEELIDTVQNEIVQLFQDEQCPAQNLRNTSSTQWRWNSPTPFRRREKSFYRQEVQR